MAPLAFSTDSIPDAVIAAAQPVGGLSEAQVAPAAVQQEASDWSGNVTDANASSNNASSSSFVKPAKTIVK